jgi:hypothetical protein
MTDINIFDMKCELTIAMSDVVEARHLFEKSHSLFSSLGIREGNTFMSCLRTHFEKTVKNYFVEKSRALTRLYAEGTPAEIELDSRFYNFDTSNPHRHQIESESELDKRYIGREARELLIDADNGAVEASDQVQAMCNALDYLNWDGIKQSFDEQIEGLAVEGRRLVADAIVKQLSMHHGFHKPKFKSGRFVFSTYSVSWLYHHDKIRDLVKFNDALNKVTEETGFEFGYALNGLISELNELGYNNEKIASRTTICKRDPIEVRCFKDKYEYHLSQGAFDAIQAFISMYGDDQDVDAVMSTAELAQPKAA